MHRTDNGASYNYIQGNNIQSNATASMDYSSAGIYSGNTIDEGNIIAGNTIAHGYYGIFLSGDWMALNKQYCGGEYI
jgi:hypothetical protein